jgi:hypothetical protein
MVALALALARDRGITTVFVPAVDAAEVALVEGMAIIPVEHLAALAGICAARRRFPRPSRWPWIWT